MAENTTQMSPTQDPVKFVKATNVENGIKASENDKDAVVFVKPEADSHGRIFIHGKEYDGRQFKANTTPAIAVGALKKSTNIGGKSAFEVLDMIVNPEYAPKYTKGSITIICKNGLTGTSAKTWANSAKLEVGEMTPTAAYYSATIIPTQVGSAKNSTNKKEDRDGVEVITPITVTPARDTTNSNFNSNSRAESEGKIVFKASVTLNDGDPTNSAEGKVVSSKGNDTNLYATEDGVLLADGIADTQIVDGTPQTGYHVEGDTVSGSHTIYYYYAVHASTGENGAVVKQTLQNGTLYEVTLRTNGSSDGYIKIPDDWELSEIHEFIQGSWATDALGTWDLLETRESVTIGGGQTKSYKVYKRQNTIPSDMQVKFIVNKNPNN